MILKNVKALSFFLFSLFCFSQSSWSKPTEIHIRTGYFLGNYSGPINSSVKIPGALDIDYSIFTSNQKAINFRTMTVMEFPNIKTFYSFVGAGLRFFNTSPAYPITIEEDGYTFASNPKTRRYLGFEIGLAQAILVSYGNVLQTTSSLIAANLNAGYTYALGPSWGLSSQINISIGFGYSSVSVLATSLTGLLGINFFF